jgi:hypothetical protein
MNEENKPVVCWKCIIKFKRYRECAIDFIEYFKDDKVMLERSGLTKEKAYLISIGKAKIQNHAPR